jgi:hypothetical protein
VGCSRLARPSRRAVFDFCFAVLVLRLLAAMSKRRRLLEAGAFEQARTAWRFQ